MHETAEYALFSKAEMDRRYNRARELMARRRIDALLITGEENFHYFSGTSASIGLHASLTRPSVLILPLERDPIILTQGKDYIVLSTYVSDIRGYDDVLSFPPSVVLQALKDVTFKHNRIGAELGQEQRMGIPVGAYLAITESLKQLEFVDAADIIVRVRMVKSSEELTYIRKAAEITGRARQRLFREHVTPGMTEHDVARTLKRLILEEGGDGTSFIHFQLDLPGCKNQFHYDRVLKPGSVLAVDAGAYARMYTIDYPRMATLGKATELQKKVHRIVREVTRKMADALKPGLRCSELHRVAVEAIEASGASADRPEKLRGGSRFGHGQGMQLTEPPSVNPNDHTELEVGMVLSTEPGVRIGDVQFLWEDVHVVTENGHEQLTLENDELVEIPW